MKYSAFLFDLNGTLINDMAFHEQAWFHVLNNDLKAGLSMEQVKANMYGKNSELYDRVFGAGSFTEQEKEKWTLRKEKIYQQNFLPHLKLINGLGSFLQAASESGIKMAIGTAADPFNINYVFDNIPIRQYFEHIVSAKDVTNGKPHPEVFIKAADRINAPYPECIVFEDSPKGIEAAANAGMKAIAITTYHSKAAFEAFNNILFVINDYTDERLESLIKA